jgi:hypothetical protein
MRQSGDKAVRRSVDKSRRVYPIGILKGRLKWTNAS